MDENLIKDEDNEFEDIELHQSDDGEYDYDGEIQVCTLEECEGIEYFPLGISSYLMHCLYVERFHESKEEDYDNAETIKYGVEEDGSLKEIPKETLNSFDGYAFYSTK